MFSKLIPQPPKEKKENHEICRLILGFKNSSYIRLRSMTSSGQPRYHLDSNSKRQTKPGLRRYIINILLHIIPCNRCWTLSTPPLTDCLILFNLPVRALISFACDVIQMTFALMFPENLRLNDYKFLTRFFFSFKAALSSRCSLTFIHDFWYPTDKVAILYNKLYSHLKYRSVNTIIWNH